MSVIGSIIVIGSGVLAAGTAVVTALGAGIAAVGTAVAGAVGLTGLSSLAVTAIGSGVISGGITAIQGGSLEDVLKSAVIGGATAYVGGSVGNYVSKSVTAGLSGSVSATTAKGLGITAGNVAAGVTRSAIMGQDLQRGAILGVAASTTALLNMSSDFRALPDTVKNVVSASTSTLIRGGDVKEAAVMAAISSGNIVQRALNQSPELKAFMEDPKNKYATEIVLTTMNTALAASLIGGDVSKSTEDALVVATIDQMGQAFNEELTEKVNTAQKKYATANETQKKLEPNYTQQKQVAAQYEKTYAELAAVEKSQNDAIAKFNEKKAEYDKLNNDGYIENNQFYSDKLAFGDDKGGTVYTGTLNTELYNQKVNELNAAADEANKQIANAKVVFDAKLPQLQQAEAEIKALQDAALPLEQVYAAQVEDVNKYANELVNEGQKFVNSTNKSIISTIYPDFNAKEYSKINALDKDVDPYEHWISFGREEGAPISYTDAVSKDFADYGLTVPPSIAKDIATKIGTSDTPVDALDQYFAERTLTPEEVMAQATKAGVSLTAEEATELAGFGDKAKLSKNLDNYLNIVTRTPGEYTQYGEQLAGLADTIIDGKYVVDVGAVEAKETDPYLFPKDSGATMRVGSGQKASAPYTFTNQLGETFPAVNVTYSDGSVDRIMYEPATDTYKKIQLSSGNKGVDTLPEVGVTAAPETFDVSKLTVTERDELLRSSVISKEERAALIAAQQKEFNSDVGKLTTQEILELAKEKAIKRANDIKFDAVKEVDKTATPPTDTTTPTTGGTGTGTTTPPTDTGTTTPTTGGTGTPTTDTTTPTTGGTDTTTPTTGGTDTTTTTGGTTTGGTDTTTPPPPPPPTDTTTTPKTDTTTPPVDTTTTPTDTTTTPTDTTKPPTDTTTPPTDTTTPPTKPPTGGVGDIVKPTADQLRQRQQRTNQLLSLLGAGGGGQQQQQQINVKAPELAKINYIYDISGPSIFAVPYSTSLDGTETGTVDDLRKIMKR